MRKAYSYVRFSDSEQSSGDSLRRQVALRQSYCEKRKLVLDDSLRPDEGVSAFRGKNITEGHLGDFIRAVEAKKVPKGSYLVIEKIDRFSRHDADIALAAFTKLVKAGITIVTLEPEREYDERSIKGFGLLELVVHFILANEESQKNLTGSPMRGMPSEADWHSRS